MAGNLFQNLQLLYTILLLVQPASSLLVGWIRPSPNPFAIEIIIKNPTEQTISVLKWNNIFDTVTPLPYSFDVRDDQGYPIQLATTYAMRAGMTDADFHHLPPEANFSVTHDLRSWVQTNPNRLYGNVTVGLPGGLRGVMHDGTWTVPTAAAANLTGKSPKLGDFTAAGLQDIQLDSFRTSRNLGPLFESNVPAPTVRQGGIEVDENDCQGPGKTNVTFALHDAGIYAKALSSAAEGKSNAMFSNYFLSIARPTVSRVASSAQRAIYGQGPRVGVYCTNRGNICGSSTNILGHTSTPSWLSDNQIVLCPRALALPLAPPPCSKRPGVQVSATASHVMLHLILTLNNVVGETINGNVYGSGPCQLLKSSRLLRTTQNPDSYAQLAIAQWAYGLGPPSYHGPKCPPPIGVVPGNQ